MFRTTFSATALAVVAAGLLAPPAHSANPVNQQTGLFLLADDDNVVNDTSGNLTDGIGSDVAPVAGRFDNELLDAHYIAGDGRVNENIGLTAVHEIFHSEHNRQVQLIKDLVTAELANGDTAFATDWVLASVGARTFTRSGFSEPLPLT